jgi:tRNA (guanine37-N1)-methyltransferase
MRIDVVTIFPGFFAGPLEHGVLSRAIAAGVLDVNVHDLRQWAHDRHHVVDDRPFGGGAGMVLKPEPMVEAVETLRDRERRCRVVLTSPQGRRLDQAVAAELAGLDQLVILCGRYEGVDERVVELVVDDEISIGDLVLSGGELAACLIIDALARLLPGTLGCDLSAQQDSFTQDGLLDCAHYTRPAEFRGLRVPEVLLSGNHQAIAEWRRRQSLERTWSRRPDLLDGATLSEQDREVLNGLQRLAPPSRRLEADEAKSAGVSARRKAEEADDEQDN